MKPPPFSYAAPTTLAEAVGLLTEHAEAEPRVLAGGQSLIPLMNFRLAKPGYLIDLRHVAGLNGIRREGDTLVIGAMTTMSEVERSPEVAVAAPLLAEAAGLVAHTPVRNRGTVGGSLAHADPAAELPAVALASGADLVAAGPAGSGRSRPRSSSPGRSAPPWSRTRSSPRSGCRCGPAGTRSSSSPGSTPTSPWSGWPRSSTWTRPDPAGRPGAHRRRPDRDPCPAAERVLAGPTPRR